MRWACAHSERCISGQSCMRKGQCHDGPMCTMLFTIGTTAGVVLPGAGASKCGYCAPSIYGTVCFCPTRVELFRRACGARKSPLKEMRYADRSARAGEELPV